MAEAITKVLHPSFFLFSAGVQPEKEISIYTIKVLSEIGIQIENTKPKSVEIFNKMTFDTVICFGTNAYLEALRKFPSTTIHFFDITDPFNAKGTDKKKLKTYRQTRDEIKDIVENLSVWKQEKTK